MKLKNIQPFVRQAIIAMLDERYARADISTWLRTPDCRLFYVISGYGRLETENEIFELTPGCAILFQAGLKYMWNIKSINYIAINFDYTMDFCHIKKSFHPIRSELFNESNIMQIIDFEDAPILNKPLFIKEAFSAEFFFRTLATELYVESEFSDELLSSCLKTLIISLVRIANTQKHKKHSAVQKIIQHIQNHYDEEIDNEKISGLIHLNSSYANRIFKQYTGTTMHKFLVNYRINLALELLRTSSDSINEIANAVGFTDIPHFVKTFKKFTGKTPSEYRNSDSK